MRLHSWAFCALAATAGFSVPAHCEDLVISEIMASNRLSATDEDGDSSDWIEIYNPGPGARSLADYALSNDPRAPRKWRLPHVTIPEGGVRVVWMSGKGRHVMPPETVRESPHIPFDRRFIQPGESWRYLLAAPGAAGPPVGWTAPEFDDRAWAIGPSGFGYDDGDDRTIVPEGTIAVLVRRAFSVEDTAGVKQLVLQVDYDDGFVAYLNGVRVAGVNTPDEHPGFQSVATSKHEPGSPERFDLTRHVGLLVEGENVLAIAGLNDSPSTDMSLIPSLGTLPPIPHANFRLPRSGGVVVLSNPAGKVIDRIDYAPQEPDQAFGRSFSGAGEVGVLLTPTPGRRNGRVSLPAPVTAAIGFEPGAGRYDEPIGVAVALRSSSRELVPRYTTSGADPTADDARVDGPIEVTASAVIRVAGFIGRERATSVRTASYFVGPPLSKPTISIALAPEEFERLHLDQDAHGRAAERPAHLEIFEPSGGIMVSTDFGLRLHGGYGRKGGLETKKSYRAYFREDYGAGTITPSVIPDARVRGLDKIVLRAGYNDRLRRGGDSWSGRATQIRDQVIRDLHADMGGVAARGTWYGVYINMRYWGLYNVTERLDEAFLQSHLGEGDWDIIKTGDGVVSGSADAWLELDRFARTADLSLDENYRELARRVDIADFTAYVILNLWAQNHDWPHNNWYAFRKADGGRWRFLSWDAEWGMGLYPTGYGADSYEHIAARKDSKIGALFAALARNPGYRDYFRNEVERHLEGALSPDNVIEKITRHQREIAPLMNLECSVVVPGNSLFSWIRSVQSLVQFARNRPAQFRVHTREYFAGQGAPAAR